MSDGTDGGRGRADPAATARLAGFFAAHAVWCVAEGETLVPLYGYERADGTRGLERAQADALEDGAAGVLARLERGACGAVRAVAIYDAYVTLETGRTDALIVDAREAGDPPMRFRVIVPYRHAESEGGFAVHRPKFHPGEGLESLDATAVAEAFFEGVEAHEEGAAVWDAALDESR